MSSPKESTLVSLHPKLSEKKLEKERKGLKGKKIFKSKRHNNYNYFEKKNKNIEEASSLLNFPLDSRAEKKRVYTKRTTEKIRRWTKEESEQYEKFIDMYSDIFNESGSKRVTKVFIQMSQFIGTKTPSQCRSHHQKFFKRLQRSRLLAAGHIINEEDFKKKRKNHTKKQKAKKEIINEEPPSKIEETTAIDECVSNNIIKEPTNSEKIEENKPILIQNMAQSNSSTNIPAETNESNPSFVINNNYYYHNNYYCENQNIINNHYTYNIHPPNSCANFHNSDSKMYLRKPSFYEDKEFAYLLENKQRRKSSFSFFCGNNSNNNMEQDFNNFEKIYLSTALPASGFPYHYDYNKTTDFFANDEKLGNRKNIPPIKEEIKIQKNES